MKAQLITPENRFDLEPDYISGEYVAYIKGSNGHYYLREGRWSGFEIIRLQRRNQVNVLDYIDFPSDIELVTHAIPKFEEIVRAHKPFRKKHRVPDRQQQRCYQWEARLGNESIGKNEACLKSLTKNEAIKKVEEICGDYGVRPPSVFFNSRGHSSYARGSFEIKFLIYHYDDDGEGLVSLSTIVHEVAHIIDNAQGRLGSDPGHGPRFVGLMIEMMARYMGYDRDFMEELARQYKIKWTYDRSSEKLSRVVL